MRLTADYHTHTTYSDGKGTIEDNVKSAIKSGLKTIGISDHSYGHAFYGIKREDVFKMRREVNALQPKYPQIKILLGLEANILNEEGDIDIDDEVRSQLDYLMAGYHFGSTPRHFKDIFFHLGNYTSNYHHHIFEKIKKINTSAYINALNRHDLFAITHPGAKAVIDLKSIATLAREKNVLLEINARHGHLSVEELKCAYMQGAKFIIGSDAHRPEDVAKVESALIRASDAKLILSDIYNVSL